MILDEMAGTIKNSTDAILAIYWGLKLVPGFQFDPSLLSIMLTVPTFALSRLETTVLALDRETQEYCFTHPMVVEGVYDNSYSSPTIIEQALDDTPIVGGKLLNKYKDYDQAFVLLSNLNKDGTFTKDYRTISIEAYINGPTVTAVTVKDPPTAIKGVINTYLPLKIKEFKYSTNFAAWKNVPKADRWGNFTIKDLKLAEGQNIIAFKATSFANNRMNQHLKIIVNTIPMLISKMTPKPNTYTNNPKPTISGEFNKSVYSTGRDIAGAIPTLISSELYKNKQLLKNLLNDPNFKQEQIKVNDYHTKVKFSYTPTTPLPDGEYEISVKAKSSVGISQGIWSFWIDTKPPEIEISF
ncbi:MAG: hypothetical protein HQ564_01460 [Candidatus Saganbacteria bacterium]|nr:hypothetical protein [Candidatus Saganbacteria bacterium]